MAMTRKDVIRVVEENVEAMRTAMRLDDWVIRFEEGRLDSLDGSIARACCNVDASYRELVVTFDAEACADKDEQALLDTIRHELLHAIIGSFYIYRTTAVDGLDASLKRVLDTVFSHAQEHVIGSIERMLDVGLKMNATKMSKLGKKRLGMKVW